MRRRRRLKRAAGVLAMVALAASACAVPGSQPVRLAWSPVADLAGTLPAGVQVMTGADPSVPLRAWLVRADLQSGGVELQVAVAHDDDARESPTDFARRPGVRVVVNGGYFRLDDEPATPVGLLLVDGQLISPPLRSVLRGEQRYFVARGALGVFADGAVDIAWVSGRDGSLYEWSAPLPNAADLPAAEPDLAGLPPWPARHAVAAGPVLLQRGELAISTDAEVFFGSSIPEVHPRTAACLDAERRLLLVVVDGRQRDSRGVDLQELASILLDLGCQEAINLDGGGSSALVVDGRLLNHPAGSDAEREVLSALALVER